MTELVHILSSRVTELLFGLDKKGRITVWSAGMEALTQLLYKDVEGQSWQEIQCIRSLPISDWVEGKAIDTSEINVLIHLSKDKKQYKLKCHQTHDVLMCELAGQDKLNEAADFLFVDNPLPMIIYDVNDLKILEVNNAAIDQYGWSRDEFLNLTIADIRPEEDLQKLLESVKNRKSMLSHSGEWRHKTKSGKIFPVEILSHLTRYTDKDACLVMANNIESRKNSETELAKSEALYRLIVETSQEGIWMTDVNEITSFVNPKTAEMLGYTPKEMIGKSIFDFMDEEAQLITNINLEKRKKGINEQYDLKFKRKDGSDFWGLLSANAIMNTGEYKGSLTMISDMSRKRETEMELRISEAKYKSLIESSLDAILILGYPEGKINGCNLQAELLFGQNEKQLKEQTFSSFLSDKHKQFESEFKKMLKLDSELFSEEYTLKNNEGILVPVDISMNVLEASGHKIIPVVVRDITSRKYAEKELRETNRKIETLMENLPGAAYSAEAIYPFKMKFISGGISNLSGYESTELLPGVGRDFRDLIVPEHKEKILSYVAEYVKAKEEFQISYRIEAANNMHRWVLENGKPVWSETEQKMILEGYLTDVTHLKEAEENLQRSHEFFKAILENSFDGVGVFDKDGIVKFQGPSLHRILGYHPSDLLGRSIFEIVHEEDVPKALKTLSLLLENPGVPYNTVLRMISRDGEYVQIQTVMINQLNNKSIAGIIGNYRQVGEFNDLGSQDILSSPSSMEPKLRPEFKSVSITAHEQFLHLRDAENNPHEWMDAVVDFSRNTRKELKITDVDPIRLISQVFNEDAAFTDIELAVKNVYPMKVRADNDQLTVVFKELILNSVQHNKESSNLVIKAGWINKIGGPVLEYSDNGNVEHGLDVKDLFQPFIVGDKSRPGLGLAKVKNIIERMEGKISAEINRENSLRLFIQLPFVDYLH